LIETPAGLSSREGLLQVDSLLPPFFERNSRHYVIRELQGAGSSLGEPNRGLRYPSHPHPQITFRVVRC
jgi:hypothetical protein